MDISYQITFKGVSEKHAAHLDKMLRDDIAGYSARQSMDEVEVELLDEKVKPEPKPKPKKPAARKGGK